MRLALEVAYGYDEHLIFAQQLGADAVVVALDEWGPVAGAAHRVRRTGLELAAVALPDAGPEDAGAVAQALAAA
ncbi:MAG: hypothetical protein ABIL09_25010, partial [Gemmatimonadota bacterium]